MVSDSFFVAFKLPNFFRRVFAEGAFSAAFVPIFCSLLGDGTDTERRFLAKRFAEDALSVLFCILLFFTVVMQLAMPWAMLVLAPGFSDDPEKLALATRYTQITFPYLMLISLVALLSAVLNGLHRFAAAAAAPILLNAVLILALLFHSENLAVSGLRLSIGLTVAGIAQLVWMMWALHKAGFSLELVLPKLNEGVRELGRLMLPVALGAGAMQINLVVDVMLASFLPEGSLSYLYYADRLNQLPIGVVGVALGTVLLPALTRALAAGNFTHALHQHNRALEAALFLTLPAALAFIVISSEIVAVLFQRGAFNAVDTVRTAGALMAFSAGLPAYVLIKVLIPGYFARKDTKTPVKIALACMTLNFIVNIVLMQYLSHVGLALGTAISAWANVFLLYRGLVTRDYFVADSRLKQRLSATIGATLAMAALLFGLAHLFALPLSSRGLEASLALVVMMGGGLAMYLAAAWLFGALRWSEAREILGFGRREI